MRAGRCFGALVALLLAAACGHGPSAVVGAEPGEQLPGAPLPLEVLEIGRAGRLVSVLVRNPNPTYGLRDTGVAVTARSKTGAPLGHAHASTGDQNCCTVISLPPHGTVGFYVDLPRSADGIAVDSVTVGVPDNRWVPWTGTRPGASTANVVLSRTADGAVVTGTLTTTAALMPYVFAQAVVEDPWGHLVAVVTGVAFCHKAREPKEFSLKLDHPLPVGSKVRAVNAVPFGKGELTGYELPRC
ncbi:MAG: hypothetical protein QOE45_445 [Frankiaceae bacterium]|nr:hypothetical protein [Frankiaceae bacterium]